MEKITAYKSDGGRTFDNEFDAHRDDLLGLLMQGADNKPCAIKVTDYITANLVTFAGLLGHMAAVMPQPEPEWAARGLI